MSTPINIKYPEIIKKIIKDIKLINKKLNDDTDLTVAIEAKTIATNNKNEVENLKTQQQENINKFDNILAIANEGNERSKVNTQRLDLVQGKAEAAYNQIGRIDSMQGDVNVAKGNVSDLQTKVNPLIGDVNANKTNITNLINRMDTTEGKANGADQRSLVNSDHIEDLYDLFYNYRGELNSRMGSSRIPLKNGEIENSYGNVLINVILKNKRSSYMDYEIYRLIGGINCKETINIYDTDGQTLLYSKDILFNDYIGNNPVEDRYIFNIYVDTHISVHGTFNSDGIFERNSLIPIYVEVQHLKAAK